MGKLLIYTGVILIVAGVLFLYSDKLNFFGKLPGDIVIKNENFRIYIPIATSIALSIVISLILYLVNKLR